MPVKLIACLSLFACLFQVVSGAAETSWDAVPVCVQQLNSLKNALRDVNTQDDLLTKLGGVCDHMADRTTCLQAVQVYGAMYHSLVQGHVDAQQVCQYLVQAADERAQHLAVELVNHFTTALQVQEKAGCLVCEFVVQEVDKLLKKNVSIDKINATLHQICDSLKKVTKRLECKAAIPVILKEAEKGLDPKTACTDAKLCSNSTLTGVKSVECDFCKWLIEEVDTFIYDHMAEIKDYIDSLCHKLPPGTDTKCLDFVDPNFDNMVVKALNTTLSPQNVCGKITKLCK